MNLIVRANEKNFKEVKNMCEALEELLKDKIEEREKKQHKKESNKASNKSLWS